MNLDTDHYIVYATIVLKWLTKQHKMCTMGQKYFYIAVIKILTGTNHKRSNGYKKNLRLLKTISCNRMIFHFESFGSQNQYKVEHDSRLWSNDVKNQANIQFRTPKQLL